MFFLHRFIARLIVRLCDRGFVNHSAAERVRTPEQQRKYDESRARARLHHH